MPFLNNHLGYCPPRYPNCKVCRHLDAISEAFPDLFEEILKLANMAMPDGHNIFDCHCTPLDACDLQGGMCAMRGRLSSQEEWESLVTLLRQGYDLTLQAEKAVPAPPDLPSDTLAPVGAAETSDASHSSATLATAGHSTVEVENPPPVRRVASAPLMANRQPFPKPGDRHVASATPAVTLPHTHATEVTRGVEDLQANFTAARAGLPLAS